MYVRVNVRTARAVNPAIPDDGLKHTWDGPFAYGIRGFSLLVRNVIGYFQSGFAPIVSQTKTIRSQTQIFGFVTDLFI